jgi:hypothetical protein
MSMQIKQSIELNSIIKGVRDLIGYSGAHMGNLANAKQPVINVIYDTLTYIGLPANAIQFALGSYFEVINGNELAELDVTDLRGNIRPDAHCDYCEKPSIYLAPTPAGDHLVCSEHMAMIVEQLQKQGIL